MTGGVVEACTEYHWVAVSEEVIPLTASVPAKTLPEEHMCGSVELVGRPLVAP